MPPRLMHDQLPVVIDLSALDALPAKKRPGWSHPWTPEEDAALLKYWRIKKQADVARVLGLSVSACLKRYEELTA